MERGEQILLKLEADFQEVQNAIEMEQTPGCELKVKGKGIKISSIQGMFYVTLVILYICYNGSS